MNRCLREDWFLLPYELKLQRAHGQALREAGLLSEDEHAALCRGLDNIRASYLASECPESEAEDLHTWVEAMLTEQAGEAGRKIHTARSRNDQVATLLAMYVIDEGRALEAALVECAGVFCRQAKRWADLAFPLMTHQQFAAPGSVGFWALRYACAFDRARRHLAFLVAEWGRYCPLGCGAVAGSSMAIDRGVQARELGFEQASLNALDSTSTRDQCLDLLGVAAQVALHLQSMATDVIVFSQTPLAWTVYPRGFATGSSMMPNKTNPDAMELLRGECCAVLAAHAHATMLLKGLPSGYNRDLQCIKPVLHTATEALKTSVAMASAFLAELAFDAQRLSASLGQGAIGATLYMESKVQSGVPLREAHHAVAGEIGQAGASSLLAGAADIDRYATQGSASPAETRRTADALLTELEA